jgi:hypothetical protein
MLEVVSVPGIPRTIVVGASTAVDIFNVLSWVGERNITRRFDVSY